MYRKVESQTQPEKLGISDRETVEQIKENPYLQYFIDRSTYSNEAPFDPSLLVKFREKLQADLTNQINRRMVWDDLKKEEESLENNREKESEEIKELNNRRKLLLDGTCAPGNISYPNDLGLLKKAKYCLHSTFSC